MESSLSRQQHAFDTVDLNDPVFQQLSDYAARIVRLLESGSVKSSRELMAGLDDFLGAVYALIYAHKGGFVNRTDKPIEIDKVRVRAEQLSEGKVRTDGAWMAGFHFNSALYRISATYDRFLKTVVGHGGDVGTLRVEAEKKFQQQTGRAWENTDVRGIHGQTTTLKHDTKGTYETRRENAKFENAISAVGELLELLGAFYLSA
ncbi:MAG TPA: hypothetical protein VKB26_07535 [Candidatus Acidoferrales bacterium]|nr:hypothetical protein [Candidatus Acidoferrales bacterium]